jgi:hypothetical protein
MTYSARTTRHPYANGYHNPYVLARALGGGGGPPVFVPTARLWDGNDRNRRSGSVPTGVTNGRFGTFSMWMNLPVTGGIRQDRILHYVDQIGGGAQGGLLRTAPQTGGTAFIMNLFSTGGQTGLTMGHGGGMVGGQWHHFLYSWENTFPVDSAAHLTVFFDGVQSFDGVNGANLAQANTDLDLAYASKGNAWTQGSRSENFDGGGSENFLNGCISNFYFNIDERIDITVQANREKFRSALGEPVFLGANGELPTGNQPAFYAQNGELNPNQGYAEDLPVITGAVQDCASVPP